MGVGASTHLRLLFEAPMVNKSSLTLHWNGGPAACLGTSPALELHAYAEGLEDDLQIPWPSL
jgi:hypothetical protein